MKKIYITIGIIGSLTVGGGVLFAMSDGGNTGSSPLQRLREIVSGKENSDVCEYNVDVSGITLAMKDGEGADAVDTGFSTKQVSSAVVPATWTATTTSEGIKSIPQAGTQIKLRFTSEGEQTFADITERLAARSGTLALYINNNLVSAPRVMSKITGRDLLVNLSGSDKSVEQIIGTQNLKLNCPNNAQ